MYPSLLSCLPFLPLFTLSLPFVLALFSCHLWLYPFVYPLLYPLWGYGYVRRRVLFASYLRFKMHVPRRGNKDDRKPKVRPPQRSKACGFFYFHHHPYGVGTYLYALCILYLFIFFENFAFSEGDYVP